LLLCERGDMPQLGAEMKTFHPKCQHSRLNADERERETTI
jgi:hypothetical protein